MFLQRGAREARERIEGYVVPCCRAEATRCRWGVWVVYKGFWKSVFFFFFARLKGSFRTDFFYDAI